MHTINVIVTASSSSSGGGGSSSTFTCPETRMQTSIKSAASLHSPSSSNTPPPAPPTAIPPVSHLITPGFDRAEDAECGEGAARRACGVEGVVEKTFGENGLRRGNGDGVEGVGMRLNAEGLSD